MRRIDQLREPERFAGWLRQVAVRMAINRATRRVAAAERRDRASSKGPASTGDDPLDELIARERAQRLCEGLDRLKTLDRETLVAFYIQGSRWSRWPRGSTPRSAPSSDGSTPPASG